MDAGCITDIRRRALVPRLYWAVDEGSVPVAERGVRCVLLALVGDHALIAKV